ncbi:MAG: VWA domain-containing protein, partial [Acidimicrobiales bacterium]
AAASAARSFVADLPDRLLVGLVSFDRETRVLASPTRDHAAVEAELARLVTGPGTAAGDGIYAALDAISGAGAGAGATGTEDQTAAVILLSDGVTTVGRPVEQAAAAAAEQGVPVSTIAFGTDGGTVEVLGRSIPVPADPETMASVAEATGGRSFEASSAGQLRSVYQDIGSRVGFDIEKRDIGFSFVAVGVVLLLAAMAASLLWTSRIL